jgi:uncharacterized Zn-binding protein involved in type VI secretion
VSIPAAARVDDPIGHSPTKMAMQRAGFDLGILIEVVLLVGTGGGKKVIQGGIKALGKSVKAWAGALGEFIGGIADIMDLAIFGHDTGGDIGAAIDDSVLGGFKQETGKIKNGAERTFVEDKAAARMTDPVICTAGTTALTAISEALTGRPSAGLNILANIIAMASGQEGAWESGIGGHGGSTVADGSLSVRIEGKLAARVGDGTTCDAIITKGAERTYFGGPQVSAAGSENRTGAGFGVDAALMVFRQVSWIFSIAGSGFKVVKEPKLSNPDLVSGTGKVFFKVFDEWATTSPVGKGLKTIFGVADRGNKIRANRRKGQTLTESVSGTGTLATGAKTTRSINDAVTEANKTGTPVYVDPDDPDGGF